MVDAAPPHDGSQFGRYPFDLRTLIAVGAPGSPLRFLDVNWTLGRTGTPFDQVAARSRAAARRVADLQLCLQTPEGAVTWKREHPLREVHQQPGRVAVSIGARLRFEGGWPDYRLTLRQPEDDLDLRVSFRAWPRHHDWVRLRGLYTHHTVFGWAEIAWEHESQRRAASLPALLDHGWGRTLLPVRTPLRAFHYTVFRLDEEALLATLFVRGPLGLRVVSRAVCRASEAAPIRLGRCRCEVLTWGSAPNHAGTPTRFPRRWRTHVDLGDGPLVLETRVDTAPRPVLGDGFVQGAAWRLVRGGARALPRSGSAYVESFGHP